MINIDEAFEEILKISPNVMSFKEGVKEGMIIEFETKYNVPLPNDYKTFIKRTNGLDFMGVTIYGIYEDSVSLEGSYKFEHFEVDNEMPVNLIPFSPDGGGNHYCFDSNNCTDASCKIIFWQHDISCNQNNLPEIVNNSFAEWVKEAVIDWTLEDYDYYGNKKK